MFHAIPEAVRDRMVFLESRDACDRKDGTPRQARLRQIPLETGRFISFMAATAPSGSIVEIGASAGYSTLWLALAAMETGRHVTTYEVLAEKARLARDSFKEAKVQSVVTLVHDDARKHLVEHKNIGFCFLDAEKEIYQECYDLVIPKLVSGGLFLADNAINHYETLRPMLEFAHNDNRVDALVVPIGKGVLCCRRRA